MLKFITKLFGDKNERDRKILLPFVEKINAEYVKLTKISDDQLRNRTLELKAEVQDFLKSINDEISDLKSQAEQVEDILEKDEMLNQVDALKKDKNKKVEEILLQILPAAFAVIKETARRLKENKQLVVTATDWDKQIAAKKSNVLVQGETATWLNRWMAAGNEIEWNMLHYDVQLMGGVVLHQGKIAEMATGEGKTMVATLPVYLNALSGMGVHIVTVNDYLARRDAEWNGPIFEFHQLAVDCIDLHEPNSDARKKAYRSDIIYGTNNEFGFDYLRDNMVTNADYIVQRDHHFAIVDEVDSVLIDEARTPLIISGPVPQGDKHEFQEFKPRIDRLINAQKKIVNECLNEAKKNVFSEDKAIAEKAGMMLFRAHRGFPKYTPLIKFLSESNVRSKLQKVEGYYVQDKGKNMHIIDDELFFTIDEQNNSVELTDKGRELITQSGEDSDLFVIPDMAGRIVEIDNSIDINEDEKLAAKDKLSQEFSEKSERLHTINQLVKAYSLFERDIDYIVQDGKVMIVDEQTGRVLAGRRYSDGLHQAIESKENVKVEDATQTFATVTLQNYFRMYHKLGGMTGTAETEAAEFYQIYKLDVTVIPTHRNIVRADRDDLVYKTKKEKYNAVIDEIEKMVTENRPILVGTTSVEVSEILSRLLKLRRIPHNVLNAKLHQREAEIVAEAGLGGKVTIATNMAGRGTDIKLGQGVIESGGLAIIGTERHESRRIDRQLRGRSGRQGDPGSSQFFVSLEDDLMRLFGSERIAKIMDRLGLKEGEVIQHSLITRSITNAQKKVEENNFAMRKRLLEYDDVMNAQREVIYRRRRNALFGDRIKIDLDNMLQDFCNTLVKTYYTELDAETLRLECIRLLAFDPKISENDLSAKKEEAIAENIFNQAKEFYKRKTHSIGEHMLEGLTSVRQRRPEVKFIVVDFSDGSRRFQTTTDLDKAISSKGMEVFNQMEKSLTLKLIDDNWKEHLREMDELRTSVQNAAIEQKDPLLVYKLESFQLFQVMVERINREVISTLFRARLYGEEEAQIARQNEIERRDDFSRMKAQHNNPLENRPQANQFLGGNSQQERAVGRRERREIERTQTKKRK